MLNLRSTAALFLFAFIQAASCLAGTTWDGGGANASWGTANNWNPNGLPLFDGTESITLGTAFTSGTTITLDGNRYINDLAISTLTGFTIATGTSGTLNLRSGNLSRANITGTELPHTISAGIVLGDPAGVAAYTGIWTVAGSNGSGTVTGLTVSGNITEAGGSRSLTLNGTSPTAITLSGTNTFSGGLTVNTIVAVSSDANLGASSGSITFNTGTIRPTGNIVSSRALILTGAGIFDTIGSVFTFQTSGAISGNGNLTVLNGCALILSGSGSNGTGRTAVDGTLSIRGTVTLGTGNLQFLSNVSGGVLELGNSDFTRSLGAAAGQVDMLTGGGIGLGCGFGAYGADRVVNLGGSAATVTWNSGNFLPTGDALYFGGLTGTSDHTVDFQNGINLAGAVRSIQTTRGTGTGAEGKISGVISGTGASGLTLDAVSGSSSPGSLSLSNGNNSYAGVTTINAGNLRLTANATGTAGNTVLGSGTSDILIGNTSGALNAGLLTDAGVTISRNVRARAGNTGTATIGGNSADTSTFSGNIFLGTDGTATGKGVTLTAASGGTVTFSGVIQNATGVTSGFGVVTKSGAGTVRLTGANTYTGATTVNAGSLFINGSTASGSAITVNNSGTTLGGSGTINGSINVASSGANLSPGASGVGSTAILHTGAVTLSSGSNFNVDLNSTTAGTGYDQASVIGTVGINGSNLVVTAGSGLNIGDKFFILLNDSTDLVTGTFAQGTTVTASNNGDMFLINYLDNGDGGTLGNDISLTMTGVPEPSTYVAGLLALGALGRHQRRRLLRQQSEVRSQKSEVSR